MNESILAVDVGGSTVKLGVVAEGQLTATETCPARPQDGLAATLADVVPAMNALCRQVGLSCRDCGGIGLGLPCIVDCCRNRVVAAPTRKYEDAASVDLESWAQDAFGLPVRADNDAHLALLGEWRYGTGQGADHLVMVTLGTGVGCSVLLGGRPLRGPHFQAGVLGGFTVVNSGGRPFPETAAGCVEAETGTSALSSIARQSAGYEASQLARLPEVNYEQLFRLAASGDALANRLRDRSLELWSDFVINLVHLFDPQRVVLGGAVLRSADVVIPWIQSRVDANAWTPWGRVEVTAARFPEDAGLLGAQVMLTQELAYL